MVNWYRRLLGLEGYAELNAEAEAVPPGCEGVACLDHFQARVLPLTGWHRFCSLVN